MWLTDEHLDKLCEGITREQKARRVKYLKGLGLHVITTPSGAPMVLCSNAELVLGGLPATAAKHHPPADAQPDRAALIAHLGNKNRKREAA